MVLTRVKSGFFREEISFVRNDFFFYFFVFREGNRLGKLLSICTVGMKEENDPIFPSVDPPLY